ncbi:MAG TPA: MBL fold metallo-hydrolase [Candidatus Binatia bacterium]|jgi:phosphoribosyl 1,2-cyclic phosphodiesterase|nr:MBL fold metallo-hydrolase [Candidatus Binatia bacterium]
MDSTILVTFWGVRGSIASPGLHTVVFGGNTSCVSIETQNHIIILDAGSGIRELGQHLLKRNDLKSINGSIFLSHMHWDHIQGLPFFAPARAQDNQFTIYGERKYQLSLAQILAGQMQTPYFPVSMDAVFRAQVKFREVEEKQSFAVSPDLFVTPFRLTHPNGALGYLLQIAGRRIAYVTDHEHDIGQPSPQVREMVLGVDLLIHDAQYSREELAHGKRGWGHSAWEDVVELAIAAQVEQLLLFHHDPEATDEVLNERQFLAQEKFPHTTVAREGLKIPLHHEGRPITVADYSVGLLEGV